MTQLT